MHKSHTILVAVGFALATTFTHANTITLQGSNFSVSFDPAFWGNEISVQGNQITFNDVGNIATAIGNNIAEAGAVYEANYPMGSFAITANNGSMLSSVTTTQLGTYQIKTGSNAQSRSSGYIDTNDTWWTPHAESTGSSAINSWQAPNTQSSGGLFSLSYTTAFSNYATLQPSPVQTAIFQYSTIGSVDVFGRGSFAQIKENTDTMVINTVPAIPEPSTYALLGIGLLGLLTYQHRSRQSKPRP